MSLKVQSTYRSEVVQVEGSLYVPSGFLLSFLKCLVLRAEKKAGASALYRPYVLIVSFFERFHLVSSKHTLQWNHCKSVGFELGN